MSGGPSLIRKLFLCPTSLCQTFVTAEDDKGIWGECVKCGKTAGYVSRKQLRSYLERYNIKSQSTINPDERTENE